MNDGSEPLVLRLLFGFFPAQVIHAAARLGIADQLAEAPMTKGELAERCACDAAAMGRLLRALTCLGLADRTGEKFALNGEGALLRSDDPASLRNLVRLFCSTETWRSWGELAWSVQTGRPAWTKLFGMPAFEYLAAHSDMNAIFNEAMTEGTRTAIPGIVNVLDLSNAVSVVDVGGGNGTLLAVLLTRHPQLSGILFDTAAGVQGAADLLADERVAGRSRIQTGDFFTEVPAGADAYLLKSVIHDWDDVKCREILTRCRQAMHPDSMLYLIEPIMPDVIDTGPVVAAMTMSDLNMLVCTGGGERTQGEFHALLSDSGLMQIDLTTCSPRNGYSVIRAIPVSPAVI